jgi:hypothetical protein
MKTVKLLFFYFRSFSIDNFDKLLDDIFDF